MKRDYNEELRNLIRDAKNEGYEYHTESLQFIEPHKYYIVELYDLIDISKGKPIKKVQIMEKDDCFKILSHLKNVRDELVVRNDNEVVKIIQRYYPFKANLYMITRRRENLIDYNLVDNNFRQLGYACIREVDEIELDY